MIRRQIENFKMSFGNYRDIPCSIPCSLYSTLKTGGFIDDPYYGKRAEELLSGMAGNVSFTA